MGNKITNEEFRKGIKMYQTEMYRLAFSILKADSISQDAVGTAISSAFEHRGSLRNPDDFKLWILQIVASKSKLLLKKERKALRHDDIQLYQDNTSHQPNASSTTPSLWNAVMQLEDELRPIAVLFYYEDFSTKEISKMMKLPEGTVKSRLSRAREKLMVLV